MNPIALFEVPTVMYQALLGWGPEAPEEEARRRRAGTRPPRRAPSEL